MKNILLIEDNPEVRENTQEILELAGYTVQTAANGKRGVETARQQPPDLIICDIMMPELDGYGVLRILSKDPETAGIPFIFLTAKSEKSDLRRGMNLGADDYITKPFEEDELLQAIEIRLKKSERFQKHFPEGPEGLQSFIQEAAGLEELQNLTTDRKTKILGRKELLYSEGEYANYLYFVQRGRIKEVKMDEYGKEFVIDLIGPNQYVGYTAMMENGNYAETAEAMEETEVVMIPRRDFEQLIGKNRDVAHRFIKLLAGNVREREKRLLSLAYTPVRERVAHALLDLQERENNETGEGAWLQISREDLSNIVGTAKESLIRILSDFKKSGWVESQGTRIRVADTPALQKIISSYG